MEIVIKIPESFEVHFNQDRFKDSFERILEDCKHSAILSGIYEFETIEMLIRAFKNGTPLPKGHGNLKDVDAIHKEIERLQNGISKNGGQVHISRDQYKGLCYARGIINETPTIIEADGGGEDEVSD